MKESISFKNPLIIKNLEEEATEISEGLKHIVEDKIHHYFISSQKGLDTLLSFFSRDELRYSHCYLEKQPYPYDDYKLESIPCENMTFLPNLWMGRVGYPFWINLGELKLPDYIIMHNLCLINGEIRTSPHNIFSNCIIKNTKISTARLETCIIDGGSIGMYVFPSFKIGEKVLDIKKHRAFEFINCHLKSTICSSAFITRCYLNKNVEVGLSLKSDHSSMKGEEVSV